VAFRYLGAALAEHLAGAQVEQRLAALAEAGGLQPAPPTPAQVRAWAQEHGLAVSAGRVPAQVVAASEQASDG
jgi:protein-tyrosine-phosphatase